MLLSTAMKREFLSALWELKRNGPTNNKYGICCNLDELCPAFGRCDAYHFVPFYALGWPEHSGSDCYPVKGSPLIWGNRYNHWIGEEGSARMRLLNYLIRKLEQELAHE